MIKQRFELFISSLMSRKFIVAVLGFVLAACNYIIGWGLTEAQMALILSPLATFILAEGAADVAGRARSGQTPIVVTNTTSSVFDDSEAPDKAGGIVTGAHRIKTFDETPEDKE